MTSSSQSTGTAGHAATNAARRSSSGTSSRMRVVAPPLRPRQQLPVDGAVPRVASRTSRARSAPSSGPGAAATRRRRRHPSRPRARPRAPAAADRRRCARRAPPARRSRRRSRAPRRGARRRAGAAATFDHANGPVNGLADEHEARGPGRHSSPRTASVSAPSGRPDEPHLARRARQARDRALHHDPVDLHEHAARHARAGRPAARASSTRARSRPRTASNAASTSALDRAPTHSPTIPSSSSRCPARDFERREARIVGDAEQREHAVRDRLGRRRDRDPLAVGALVRAAGHGVRDARAEPRLLVVEVRGRRRQRRHHLQHRLEQVHVDHLPAAAACRARAARPSPRTRPRARRPRR